MITKLAVAVAARCIHCINKQRRYIFKSDYMWFAVSLKKEVHPYIRINGLCCCICQTITYIHHHDRLCLRLRLVLILVVPSLLFFFFEVWDSVYYFRPSRTTQQSIYSCKVMWYMRSAETHVVTKILYYYFLLCIIW